LGKIPQHWEHSSIFKKLLGDLEYASGISKIDAVSEAEQRETQREFQKPPRRFAMLSPKLRTFGIASHAC
jgi:hypothetical protein